MEQSLSQASDPAANNAASNTVDPSRQEAKPRIRGRIRRIKQGFGFVAGDDGNDYFFHRFGFRKDSIKQFHEVAEQDRLEFTPCQPDAKGPRAIEVIYLEG